MRASPGRELVAAGLLAFALFFAGTGSTPLIGRDEPRFAEAAREMLARGEIVVPTFGGVNRYDKPILVYWCTMASYAVFGVNERSARLPSNLAGALSVLLLAWWARRRWGAGSGLLAGGLLAVTLTFHLEARGCTADLVMLLPAVAAMLALERLVAGEGGWREATVFWLGMGLAVLAKGPVAPAFAVATAVAVWALGRRWRRWEWVTLGGLAVLGWWRLGPQVLVVPAAWAVWETARSREGRARLRRLRWGWGVPLFLAVTAPWAIAAWSATAGDFFRVGVGKHVVARSLSALESHGGFPGFYLVTAVIAAFPLFALLPDAVRGAWRRAADDPSIRFRLAWLIGPLFMLELVQTKLVHYWMLSYPAGALLVAGWIFAGGRDRRSTGIAGRVLLAAGGGLVAAVPPAVALHFGVAELTPLALALAVPLVAAVTVAAFSRRPLRRAVVVVAGTALFLLGLMGAFLPRLATRLVGPRAARRALEIRQPGERFLLFATRDDHLFFYLPLDTINCRPAACLAERLAAGTPFLGLARTNDLNRYRDDHPDSRLRVVETVRGIDLGHGRWTDIAIFRPPG